MNCEHTRFVRIFRQRLLKRGDEPELSR